ncbi:hypothetical protein P5641_00245 (plasmid) [Bacillus subtilis]|nr:hypothetical protein [Bacillus subtilis]WEY94602.1 hypothetical protein P5641_00245 [Bacillus subtilis]
MDKNILLITLITSLVNLTVAVTNFANLLLSRREKKKNPHREER